MKGSDIMPGGDGTGPARRGQGSERGLGMQGQQGGAGSSGYCICPRCGERVLHIQGIPCYSIKCPKCNELMVRDRSKENE